MVTCVSQSLKMDTHRFLNIKKEIEVIPNFVDVKKYEKVDFQHQHLRKLFAHDDEKLIVHMSNFREIKRTQDVLKVFYTVQEQLSSKLLLIGEGPEKEKLEVMAKKLGHLSPCAFCGKYLRGKAFVTVF